MVVVGPCPRIYSVSQKSSSLLKLFCNIFTQIKYVSAVKFCQYVAGLYIYTYLSILVDLS